MTTSMPRCLNSRSTAVRPSPWSSRSAIGDTFSATVFTAECRPDAL